MFKPGKNRNGYFDSKELIAQVDCAINIFEGKVNGLFLFDNAPSHLKQPPDAISATKMVKSASNYVYLFILVFTMSSEILSAFGRTNRMGHACAMASTY